MGEMLWVIAYAYLAVGLLISFLITFSQGDYEMTQFINTMLFWPLVLLTLLIVQIIYCVHMIKKATGGK